MAGIEETTTIECYPLRVHTPHTMFMNRASFMVRGRDFERHIFCPNHGPEVLISQRKLEGHRYEHDIQLPANSNAVLSEQHLFQTIVAAEPAANERIVQDRFMHLGWTWQNVANTLSHYADDKRAITGLHPFRIEAEEAFGTEFLKREIKGWKYDNLYLSPPSEFWEDDDLVLSPPPPDYCFICSGLLNEAPNHRLIMLKVCRHIFHKRCLFEMIWRTGSDTCVMRCDMCDAPM